MREAYLAEPVDCGLDYSYDDFYNWLDADDDLCALAYPTVPKADWLEAALRTGIPIMMWRRSDCTVPHPPDGHGIFLDQLDAELSGTHPDQLPVKVMKLRKAAWSPRLGGADHCGRRLTLLWDDPDRGSDPPLMMGGV